MRDRIFFPLALAVLVMMVFVALRPAIGRLPTGPVAGDGKNYDEIIIEGDNLHRIYAGGDAKTDYAKGPAGEPALRIRVEADTLSDDPLLGPHYRLAGDLEVQFSGQTIRCTIRARPTERQGAMQIMVNYSAGRVGESGWQVFDLQPGYKDYSFDFRVPIAVGDQGVDYLAIRPVVPEKTRGVWVERVTLTRLGRRANEGGS